MVQFLADYPDAIYLLYAGIALGAFMLFTGVAQLLSRGENPQEARSRRMKMIAAGASTEEVLAVLKPIHQQTIFSRLPLIGDLPEMLHKAGATITTNGFLGICALVTFVTLTFANYLMGIWLGTITAVVIGFIAPITILRARVKKRDDAMIAQLPDALDLIARGLRVGHPLNTSIHEVATEMADPIASEFGVMFDQISYGDDLVDAVNEFAERVDLEDVHYLAACIGIQHGTGGDLARIIQVLSNVVRGRITMRRKILAISSEGRLSGGFLSVLPVLIFASTSFTSPDYYFGVMDDPLFRPMMAIIAVLTLANFFMIRKLVNFRI